jgi:Protein of unknown function (DUF3489)
MNVLIAALAPIGELKVTTYTIDNENHFAVFAAAKRAKNKPETERFCNIEELTRMAETWPGARLIEVWNSLPGVVPVKKFSSRKKAVDRIWAMIEKLDTNASVQVPGVGPKAGRMARQGEVTSMARVSSKKADVLALLRRQGGATLKELMADTGWQAHSVRGFLSAALGKKMGLAIHSTKREDGERVYSIAG